ncbi:bifunctional DNA-formamidopyrimidine glycosylase/DNA-(apurinic or apyrimidinic site) lyase [Pelagibacterium xiamenense]|uniref:bifunctional DNA-formamidopyrimidine glycosylase/DNA-(apurinic or apyrimidinic site) lyase n=1 Tax=Pelagibacterium xiamenense TaxID=2901140 RepID=UPI001E3C991C|nr:bifunctional DNA-formamidopyrimidine glycosylase/DNA-(apurinic or apyrimidinic site) lyase [Pelagibacterium xiamenense]MCD7058528.1 bifunctional DNA-formamidopyrimidine glycosylase/DNA-(apurinic or apyrimidinic site) lyase [Pelagibacterium xiamenense]
MPELPEVETVRRGLAPFVEGARIEAVTLFRPDLRFPFPPGFADALMGRTVVTTGRRAKYLLFHLSDGALWLAHLGMTGAFWVNDTALEEPSRRFRSEAGARHVHFSARLRHPERGAVSLYYGDPRRFGFMAHFGPSAPNPYLDLLGPEPLGNALNADFLGRAFMGKRSPVKSVLLDQRVIAGLGNIYVCEALHIAGIAPARIAGSLATKTGKPRPALMALPGAIRTVLEDAIAAGGSTLRDFRNADGRPGYFQHNFLVYDREGEACLKPDCPGTVKRIVQAGRSSFFCPVCQR